MLHATVFNQGKSLHKISYGQYETVLQYTASDMKGLLPNAKETLIFPEIMMTIFSRV